MVFALYRLRLYILRSSLRRLNRFENTTGIRYSSTNFSALKRCRNSRVHASVLVPSRPILTIGQPVLVCLKRRLGIGTAVLRWFHDSHSSKWSVFLSSLNKLSYKAGYNARSDISQMHAIYGKIEKYICGSLYGGALDSIQIVQKKNCHLMFLFLHKLHRSFKGRPYIAAFCETVIH